ncbi:MAG: hypothetical protein WBB08_13465 [Halobacteriota archaeon]
MKTIGPLQLTVIGFDSSSVTSEIVEKLRAVRENGTIRVIDLLFVAKDEGGRITTMDTTDLTKEEAMHFGAERLRSLYPILSRKSSILFLCNFKIRILCFNICSNFLN